MWRQTAVEDLSHNPEGQHLHVLCGMNEILFKTTIIVQLQQMLADLMLDAGDHGGDDLMPEWYFHDRPHAAPLLSADETNTLSQKLTHVVSGVVGDSLGVFVGVFEDSLQVARLCQYAGKDQFMTSRMPSY